MKTINYFAVAVAAVVNYLIGYVWFIVLFSAPYVKGLGRTREQMDKGPDMFAASAMQVAGNFVLAFVFAWLLQQLGYTTQAQGLQLAILVWGGFIAAVIGPMYAFQAFPLSLFLLVAGVNLIYMVINSVILTAWK